MEPRTLHEQFCKISTTHPDRVAFQYKRDDRWHNVTWADQRATVERLACSLMALGIEHGDRVCILASTRLEWVQIDSALVMTGAVSVGIYHSNLARECAYIANHSDAALIFVENDVQLGKILSMRDEMPLVKRIVRFEGPSDAANDVMSWDEFLQLGRDVPLERIAEAGRRVVPDDLACLVYTSGTTGVPKGAMITHNNLLFTARAAEQVLYVKPHYITLLFLPLAHVYARMIVYMCQNVALAIAFAEDITKIGPNLLEVRPHFIISVPRIYEKVREKIRAEVDAAGGLRRRIFEWGVSVGWRAAQKRLAGRPLGIVTGLLHAIADRLVLSKVRAAFGGRMIWGASGAAPLDDSVAQFFHSCGIWLVEGIGMTENTSLSNANCLGATKIGTVGPAVPGVEVRIADDGEVLFRGANVMKGYFKDAEATRRAIDPDGWLHSGDVGEIDEDGFLRITDRKKDLIVTAGGKNVAPQRIEGVLKGSRFISQAVAFGDRRKFITALIALDEDNVHRWRARGENGPDGLQALIQAEVDRCNLELASYESVKKFRILPGELTIEGGELTPTFKIKRKSVVARYGHLVDEMYESADG